MFLPEPSGNDPPFRQLFPERRRKQTLPRNSQDENKPGPHCDKCSLSYKSKHGLRHHISYKHRGKSFKCKDCHKIYAYNKNLRLHVSTVHKGVKKYTCSKCDKSFGQKIHLVLHEDVHKGIRYKCDHCDSTYSSRRALRRHFFEKHARREAFKCEHCGVERLLRASSLHDGRQYKCDLCDQQFWCRYSINKHVETHHHSSGMSMQADPDTINGPETKDENKCDNCDKSFRMKIALKKHSEKCLQTVSSGAPLSQCDLCDFTSDDLQSMYQHSLKEHF